ncbi:MULTISPECIES: YtxH domain-containing protein [Flavobacterium]|uniref:YtxH domain-containing protein n=1 Tax=Flavobacterium TaxID=237 RepID=UPI001FCC583D|nr:MULTISPECIES: YtxH domain-containing protein [Flavobacterium]UOK43135.1 YtxH domain-containing protein [Flavobacterium enshiense]
MSDNTGKTVLALLAGAAIGAGLGILFAPDKGSETRRKIKEGLDHEKDVLKHRLSEVTDNIKSRFSRAKMDLESEFDHLLASNNHKKEEIIETLEKKLAELKNQAANASK